jgi:hypothetical protein
MLQANIALQAAKDVMITLGKILKIHGRAVLEYAIWYKQNHEGSQTHSEYITRHLLSDCSHQFHGLKCAMDSSEILICLICKPNFPA